MNARLKTEQFRLQDYMQGLGAGARAAARTLAAAGTKTKNAALEAIARAIEEAQSTLLAENAKDLESARARGLAAALVDRLELTPARVTAMAEGLRQVAALADPVGEIAELRYRPSGIQVGRMRVPLGVIGIIYESRPNVTADAASLCLKGGNASILRGGSEAPALEPGDRCLHRRRIGAGRVAGQRRTAGRNDRSGGCGRADNHGGVCRRDRTTRGQGLDRTHQSRSSGPGNKTP